ASVVLGLLAAGSIGALVRAQSASFAKDVQPILENNCLSCHGETMQMGKFDLRSRESALRGGTRGSDIVPGDAERSRLYRRIAGVEQPAMPMDDTPLTAAQIAAIKRWIDDGATWDSAAVATSPTPAAAALAALENRPITAAERNYWAFRLPIQAPAPRVDDA